MVSAVPKKDELMATDTNLRTYNKREVVFFRTTTGEFGPLSNMAPDYPVFVLNLRILTVEALYQACRFPDHPEIQRVVIDQMSPMTAKMKSKKYTDQTRTDWESVRVNVMRWCLRIKLENNFSRFGQVLEKTGERAIVEESNKDSFWGAKPIEDGKLMGRNVLGRLLMELRAHYYEVKSGRISRVEYPSIPHFLLLGEILEPASRITEASDELQSSLF